MRFLADENIHSGTIEALRASGHDVASIAEDTPSSSDIEVLASADLSNRILITYDTDFGELVFLHGQPAESGVILLRLSGSVASHTARLLDRLSAQSDWDGFFTTISDSRVRRKQLP